MRTVETGAQLRELQEPWSRLLAKAPAATAFNSWEWLYSWWRAYGNGRLQVHVWFDEDGRELVGALPLYAHAVRVGVSPMKAKSLSLVGDGSEDSDYLDLIAAKGYEDQVVQGALAVLASRNDWDMVWLRTLPETSLLARAITDVTAPLTSRGLVRVEHRRGGIVVLPQTFDDFVAARQARFRTRLRSLVRRFESEPGFRFECEPDNLDERLESLFDLHRRRWESVGQHGVFGDPRKRDFYRAFVPRFAERGWLRFYSLRHEGRFVAHELCFSLDRGESTMLLQEGFDPDSGRDSYGQMLRALVFRHIIEARGRRYDFLGGLTRHKEYWGAQPSGIIDIVVARRNGAGISNFYEPSVRETVARGIRRMSPRVARRVAAAYSRVAKSVAAATRSQQDGG